MERHLQKWTGLFQHGIAKKSKEKQDASEYHSIRKHEQVGLYMFFLCTSVVRFVWTRVDTYSCQ